MLSLGRFAPRTIAGQITGLLIVSVLLGVGLASGVMLYLMNQGRTEMDREIFAAIQAARIATIVKQAQASASPEDLTRLLEGLHSDRMAVRLVHLGPEGPSARAGLPSQLGLNGAIEKNLQADWNLTTVVNRPPDRDDDAIYVAINAKDALRFDATPHSPLHNLLFVEAIGALSIIALSILLLSSYAVRWITSPLSSIASAAESFGRGDGEEQDLSMDGPREMREAASALNDMRKRVRTLVRERTQMLTAISHDLRTPLTRLRLRAERVEDASLSAAMLDDILTISDMLGETLAYVREGNQQEQASLIDLPSILETIAAQFLDIGHDVSYRGPERLTFAGRSQSIGRAITNVVENATKFASHVEIVLQTRPDNAVEIEISDDGPGIEPGMLDRAFEPFFKGDSARSQDNGAGFGLGLSIARDIAERHGGEIELENRKPHGLRVRASFQPLAVSSATMLRQAAREWSPASAANKL
jgi:signal transduction histidine kinase